MAKWMVECRYLGGWGNAGWTNDDKPHRFKTKKAAEAEIDDHIKEVKSAVRRGDMDYPHQRSEYRAVKENHNDKKTHR